MKNINGMLVAVTFCDRYILTRGDMTIKEKKILIVDDEIETLRTIAFILSGFGYSTINAQNGVEAWDALMLCISNEQEIQLIITDINMPKMNGLELIEKVKTSNPLIPVIAITGYGEKQTVIELLSKGCDEYIEKPFDDTELLKKIDKVLERKSTKNSEHVLLKRKAETYRGDLTRLKEQVDIAESAYANIIKINTEMLFVPLAYQTQPLSNMGGDLLCAQNRNNGTVFLITDVSGHDMGSSFHNIVVKTNFREYAESLDPIPFMNKLNKSLKSVSEEKRMVTGIYLSIDLNLQLITIVNAGHPPLIKTNSIDKSAEYLKSSGNVMGIYDNPQFDYCQLKIKEHDRFVFFTDGIYNLLKYDGLTGIKRKLSSVELLQYVNNNMFGILDAMIDDTWSDLLTYCRYKYDDDMLLAGIEIPGGQYV